MKTEYNGYRIFTTGLGSVYLLQRLTSRGHWQDLLDLTGKLDAIHILSGDILGCSDENCPCYEAGRQKGLETDREPVGRRA